MIPLTPCARTEVPNAAWQGSIVRGKETVLLFSGGHVVLLDAQLRTKAQVCLSADARNLTAHPHLPHYAWTNRITGEVTVQTIEGEVITTIASPVEVQPGRERGFIGALFDEGGEFLWLTARRSSKEFEVQLRRTNDWRLIDRQSIEDPYQDGALFLLSAARPETVVLLMIPDPYEQQPFWLRVTRGGFARTPEPQLEDMLLAAFSPDGSRFLAWRVDSAEIVQYRYPTLRRIGAKLVSPPGAHAQLTEHLCYLEEGRLLVQDNYQLIYVVDAKRMEIEGELALEGHEPRPRGGYYSWEKSKGRETDVERFARVGDHIGFLCTPEGREPYMVWSAAKLPG